MAAVGIDPRSARIMAANAAALRTPHHAAGASSQAASPSSRSSSKEFAHLTTSRALVPFLGSQSEKNLQEEVYRAALCLEITAHRLLCSPKPSSGGQLAFPFLPLLSYTIAKTDPTHQAINKRFIQIYNLCQKHDQDTPPPAQYKRTRSIIVDLRNKQIYGKLGAQLCAFQKVAAEQHLDDTRPNPRCWQVWKIDLIKNTTLVQKVFSFPYARGTVHDGALPLQICNGNESELEAYPSTSLPKPTQFWNAWKVDIPPAAKKYREVLYPLFLKGVHHACTSLENRELCIADIGGGDGELSFQLAHLPIVKKVYLIESNPPSLAAASARASDSCPRDPLQVKRKIQVIPGDITRLNFLKALKYVDMDVILLSGIIAEQVLSKADSTQLLKKCQDLLKEDGFILVASHTSCYFNKTDFTRLGFKVLNTSKTTMTRNSHAPCHVEPFYVLQV